MTDIETLARVAPLLPAIILAWAWLRWFRLSPDVSATRFRRFMTASSLCVFSASTVSLCFLTLLPSLPESATSWLSEDMWVQLWVVGICGSVIAGFAAASARDGVRDVLGLLAAVLTFMWMIAMSIAEPGA